MKETDWTETKMKKKSVCVCVGGGGGGGERMATEKNEQSVSVMFGVLSCLLSLSLSLSLSPPPPPSPSCGFSQFCLSHARAKVSQMNTNCLQINQNGSPCVVNKDWGSMFARLYVYNMMKSSKLHYDCVQIMQALTLAWTYVFTYAGEHST